MMKSIKEWIRNKKKIETQPKKKEEPQKTPEQMEAERRKEAENIKRTNEEIKLRFENLSAIFESFGYKMRGKPVTTETLYGYIRYSAYFMSDSESVIVSDKLHYKFIGKYIWFMVSNEFPSQSNSSITAILIPIPPLLYNLTEKYLKDKESYEEKYPSNSFYRRINEYIPYLNSVNMDQIYLNDSVFFILKVAEAISLDGALKSIVSDYKK